MTYKTIETFFPTISSLRPAPEPITVVHLYLALCFTKNWGTVEHGVMVLIPPGALGPGCRETQSSQHPCELEGGPHVLESSSVEIFKSHPVRFTLWICAIQCFFCIYVSGCTPIATVSFQNIFVNPEGNGTSTSSPSPGVQGNLSAHRCLWRPQRFLLAALQKGLVRISPVLFQEQRKDHWVMGSLTCVELQMERRGPQLLSPPSVLPQ